MGGPRTASEIPLLPSFFCLYSEAESDPVTPVHTSGLKQAAFDRPRSALKTVSGGEFDWGGTSVKR